MKKKIIKIVLILIIAISVHLLLETTSNAALSISTSQSTVSPGENFLVTISVSSNEAGAITLSANNGTLSSTDIDLMSQSSVTISCTAGNSGTISIYASGPVANYDTETEGQQSASKSVEIVVPVTPQPEPSNPSTSVDNQPSSSGSSSSNNNGSSNRPTTTTPQEDPKSNDSTLSGLTIEGYELYPEFDTNTREYNVKVTNDITTVNILPTVNHSEANYSIEGLPEELVVGKNVITIVVTAEDGTTSNYVINITREREGLNIEKLKFYYTDEAGNRQELQLTPELTPELFEYNLGNVSHLVSKLDVEVIANLEQAQIEIIGNENLLEGLNEITITVTVPSESEEVEDEVLTYKITVNKEKEPTVTLIGRIKNWFNGVGAIGTENTYKILMGALIICSIAMVGLSIYLVKDYKKYKMIIEKVSEITKINSSNTARNLATESENTNKQILEEMQNKTEEVQIEEKSSTKSKGRHF